VDPALEGSKADPAALELKACAQLAQRDQVVKALGQTPGGVVGREPKGMVGIGHRGPAS